MEIVEYYILINNRYIKLIEAVNLAIAEGWQPFGDFKISKDSQYYQVIVKYKK